MTHRLFPYLIFDGNCKEAMEFYQSCLGGEITKMQTVADSPIQVPEEHQHRIFDSQLKLEDLVIKASDNLPQNTTNFGTNFNLFVMFPSKQELRAAYDALLDGGQAIMPLPQEENLPPFGMLRDKFNIQWMLTINH